MLIIASCYESKRIVMQLQAVQNIKYEIRNGSSQLYCKMILSTTLTVQFASRFDEQDARIKALEERLEIQESSMAVLQKLDERVDKKMEALEKLEQRVENGEQYSRRTCLRLYNLDLPQDGSNKDCLQKVESFQKEINCGVTIDMVERAHRIGESSVDDDGKIRQQMIVKFRGFRERTMVYRGRKKLQLQR